MANNNISGELAMRVLTIPCNLCGSMAHSFHYCVRRALLRETIETQLEWVYGMIERWSPPVNELDNAIVGILRVELRRIIFHYRTNCHRIHLESIMNIKLRHKMAKQGGKISHRDLKKCRTRLFP